MAFKSLTQHISNPLAAHQLKITGIRCGGIHFDTFLIVSITERIEPKITK